MKEKLRYCVACGLKVIPYEYTVDSSGHDAYKAGTPAKANNGSQKISVYHCVCHTESLLAPSQDITGIHCPSCDAFINLSKTNRYCGNCGVEII